jgi:microcystin-dependent protein
MKSNTAKFAAVLAFFGVGMIAQGFIEASRAAMWQWSKTSASNAIADPTVNWAEGMPPGVVNDSARAMMARIAEWRDDLSGSLVTSGSSTAYTLTTNQGLPSPPNNGQAICFAPHATNGGAATLAADGGTAYPLQASLGVAASPASLIQGTPYCGSYNASSSAWILFGGVPTSVPLGAVLPYTGSIAPTSNFALPFGQAISRTTFAPYFALVGTTYGAGDGSTTFNLPDLRGRAIHGLDNMGGTAAGRIGTALSTDGGTINGQQIGSAGGSQSHAQTSAEMAVHNHGVNDPTHTHTATASPFGSNPTGGGFNGGNAGSISTGSTIAVTVNAASTGVSIQNAGSGNAMALVSPTMVLPYIVRVQ